MRLLLTKSYNTTVLIIIIVLLTLFHLCLLFLVRLGAYTANLSVFYFYRLIGKLTDFLQLQEFRQWKTPSTSVARCCPHNSRVRSVTSSSRLHRCRTTDYDEYRWGTYTFQVTHSPITHSKLSTINLVSIFRCFSSSPHNPVYVRSVDPSVLVFSLSLHRHPHICILFSSRFICSS